MTVQLIAKLERSGLTITEVLASLRSRWQVYEAAEIDRTISRHDDMFIDGRLDGYLAVGRSAMELISEAMLLGRRGSFGKIFDMPCGGGRVTRHLVKFFPDAEVFISDVEKRKQADVASQFGVQGVDIPPDFSEPSPLHYDLIFVGSLFTHLQEHVFSQLLSYCIDALAPQGILIATTHGRWHTALRLGKEKKKGDLANRSLIKAIDTDFREGRPAFSGPNAPIARYGGTVYGGALTPASWVVRQVEMHGDAVVIGIKEAGWKKNHDALFVQKC